jgi:hypothetical protein
MPVPASASATQTGGLYDLALPKASAADVAMAILDGAQRGEEEIFPDPMSAPIADGWRGSAGKAPEREFAQYVQTEPATA